MCNSIQAAFAAAGLVRADQIVQDDAKPRRSKRRPNRKYGRSRSVRSFSWEHDLFGELQVSTNLSLGKPKQEGPNTWVRVEFRGEPRYIEFEITGRMEEGVRVLFLNSGVMTDMSVEDRFPQFRVPIRYEGEKRVPMTHMKMGDDRDIVLLRPDGTFVNFEVSVVTRRGVMWACGQETYGGQVVVMDLEDAKATPGLDYHEVDGAAVSVIPLYGENAYPDHENPEIFRNFLKIMPGAKEVLEYAYRHGSYAPLENCLPAEWEPQWPELTERQAQRGWKKGVVTFFNLVLGWGFVLSEDGKHCFVHFKSIIDEEGVPVWTKDEFPVIQPMTGVLIRYKEEDGKYKAAAVRVP